MSAPLYAGVEAGGTKILCAVSDASGEILAQTRLPTKEPQDTLPMLSAFFAEQRARFGPVAAAGVGSFGPLDLDPASPGFGALTTTPKPGWSGVNICDAVAAATEAPTVIDTDVNAAALAEGEGGAALGLHTFAYVTVGTGLGVGAVVGGRALRGLSHPEAGHMRPPRAPGDEDFPGVCPFHGDCLEGLASGPALAARWGVDPASLPDDHPAWTQEAHYIAVLCASLTYTLSPQRIIIGGGVFQRTALYDLVRRALAAQLAGYALTAAQQNMPRYIAAPGLTDTPPGLAGALIMAREASAAV